MEKCDRQYAQVDLASIVSASEDLWDTPPRTDTQDAAEVHDRLHSLIAQVEAEMGDRIARVQGIIAEKAFHFALQWYQHALDVPWLGDHEMENIRNAVADGVADGMKQFQQVHEK